MAHKTLLLVFQTGLLLSLLHNVLSRRELRLISEECEHPNSTEECIEGAVCKPCKDPKQAHCSEDKFKRKVKVCTCTESRTAGLVSLPTTDNTTCWSNIKFKTRVGCRSHLDCFGTEGVCVYNPLELQGENAYCYCHKDLIMPTNKLRCLIGRVLLHGFVCKHDTDCSSDIGSSYCVREHDNDIAHCMCDDFNAMVSADRKRCYPASNRTNETCWVDADCPGKLPCALNSSPHDFERMEGVCIVLPQSTEMFFGSSVGNLVQPLAFFLLWVFTLLTV